MKKLSVFVNAKALTMAMLALALVVGFAFVGCKNEVEEDNPLNGTWRAANGDEFILNNGNFTAKEAGVDYGRGTYTVSGSNIVFSVTEIYIDGITAAMLGTTAGWKNRSQVVQLGLPEADINEIFTPMTVPYTLNGDTLTINMGDGPVTYTRQ